MNRKINVQLD